MTLQQDALDRRQAAKSPHSYVPMGLTGELWRYSVTRGGVEIVRSSEVPLSGFSIPSIPLPHHKSNDRYSLWLVGSSFVHGYRLITSWARLKFSISLRNTWVLIPAQGGIMPPAAIVSIRRSLYPPRKQGRKPSQYPTRSSRIRPSPEIVTKARIDCRNRDGVFLVLQTFPYDSYSRTWAGVRTPGFGSKKRRALPINNHNVTIWTQSAPSQYHLETHVSGSYNWWIEKFGDPGSLGLPGSISHIAYARNLAIRRIIERTGTGIEGNLAQDLTQFKQTAKTIETSALRIARSLFSLRRGNLTSAINALFNDVPAKFKKGKTPRPGQSVADNWLSLQYGWKPLLQDIDGAMRSLASFNFASYAVHQVTGSGKAESTSSQAITTYGGFPSGRLTTRVETRCKIGLRYSLDSRLRSFLAQTGFTSPLNLAWEVLPYSFVVDWFLPIGPYLETLSAWDGLVFLDGFETQFTRKNINGVISASFAYPAGGNYQTTVQGDYQAEGIQLNRIKLTTFPAATFPTFKNPFSTGHALNAIALLRTAHRG